MYLVREIFYCKPGKVRPMVEKFLSMNKVNDKYGYPKGRLMTDVCSERYWTIISEYEVPSMQAFDEMIGGQGMKPEAVKEFEAVMKDYHDFIDHGHREIYKIEG